MATSDLIRPVLQSLIEVTNALSNCVQNEDFLIVEALLDRRAQLLDDHKKLVSDWKDLQENSDNKSGEFSPLKPLIEVLQRRDQDFVTSFTRKKEEVAEKLMQAQNQQKLLAYSR
jgi:hypothetical protein